LAHSDVAPARKQDPGELFPWSDLALAGVGLWPRGARRPHRRALKLGMSGSDVLLLQRKLAAYGYCLARTCRFDAATALVVPAFQRHFRPTAVTGIACGETQGLLERLLALKAGQD